MKNTLPQQLDRLFTKGEEMAVGCHNHEAAIGLLQNKEANIRADLTAARNAENAFQAARTIKLNAVEAQSVADRNATPFLTTTRDVLKPHLGTSWSQAWAEAGFVSNSIAVPSTLADRVGLLMSLKMYLAAHPDQQVETIGVTADAALNHFNTLSAALTAANNAVSEVGRKKEARDAAEATLRKRMRGLITELMQLLPGDDARWRAFGLNAPDAVGIPEVPEGLKVARGATGHLLATWDSAALAARYRVFKKVVGVDNEFTLVTTVTETESNMNTFTPGQIVRVRISAVNDAGESLPSDSVEQTVP